MGKKEQSVSRTQVKLTPEIPTLKITQEATKKGIGLNRDASQAIKVSWAGIGGYCLTRDDMKLSEYVAPFVDRDGIYYAEADEDEVEKK